MRPSFHHLSENIPLKSHPDGGHLSHSATAIDHVLTPALDGIFELRKVLGHLILSNILHHISNIPEISPFGVKRRWRGGEGLVVLTEVFGDFLAVSGFLSVLGSGSDLKIIFREDIRNRSPRIEFLGPLVKELLKHVKEFIVLLNIDPGIFDDKTTIMMQSLSNSFTVLRVTTTLSKERLHIDDGNRQSCTE